MEDDKDQSKKTEDLKSQAPADALSRTPDDLAAEASAKGNAPPVLDEKPVGPFRRVMRKINIYLMMFILILVVAIAISAVLYLNSTKEPDLPKVMSQELTEDALKQLANTDATVGNSNQTLTIRGNAVIDGQTLMRGDLNIAGNLQTGGSIRAPSLAISGASNLGTAQINSLQVATTTDIVGGLNAGSLNVSGASSFSGPVTTGDLTTTNLVIAGNGSLSVPNHIKFPGSSPSRTSTSAAALGTGGSASIGGSDTAGTININTGNNPQPGCFARFTFNQPFERSPYVIVSPVGAGAGRAQYYTNRTTSYFEICSAGSTPANQSFAYDYFIAN